MYKKIAVAALLGLSVHAHADDLARPDAHAPIGVMGDHTHHKGEIMLSYRYMDMEMDGNRTGNKRVSQQAVYAEGFMVAPLNMDMKMHMLGAMYAPSDQLTLMAMVPVAELTMDHQVGSMMMIAPALRNQKFTTEASGLGDIKLGGLYNISKDNGSNLIANFTLSLPTGSIDEKDVVPFSMGSKVQLPYPMQLGSGTYDLIPGLTYTQLEDNFSWGAQAKATIRLGDNDNGYTLGDRFALTTWVAKAINDNVSFSARLSHDNWQDIDGSDPSIKTPNGNPSTFIPTANTNLRAGKRTDLGLGVNFIIADPGHRSHRIALEVSQPVAQDLDGPQLETDQVLTLGYQIAL